MAATYVQGATYAGAGTNFTPASPPPGLAMPANVNAGDLILVALGWSDVTTTAGITITDSQGNTWTFANSGNSLTCYGGYQIIFAWCFAKTSGPLTVQITPSSSAGPSNTINYLRILLHEYSGVGAIDQGATSQYPPGTASPGMYIVTTSAHDLIVGFGVDNNGVTGWQAPMTQRLVAGSESTGDLLDAGAANPTGSVAYYFTPAGGGGGGGIILVSFTTTGVPTDFGSTAEVGVTGLTVTGSTIPALGAHLSGSSGLSVSAGATELGVAQLSGSSAMLINPLTTPGHTPPVPTGVGGIDLVSWFFGGPNPADALDFETYLVPGVGVGPAPTPIIYGPGLQPPLLTVAAMNAGCAPDLPWEKPTIMLTIENTNPFNLVGLADASFEGTTGSAVGLACSISDTLQYSLDGLYSLRTQFTGTTPVTGPLTGSGFSVQLGPYPAEPSTQYTVMGNVLADPLDVTMPECQVELQFFDNQNHQIGQMMTQALPAKAAWFLNPGIATFGTSPPNTDHMMVLINFVGADYAAGVPTSLSVTQHNPGSVSEPAAAFSYVVTSVNAIGESTPSAAVTYEGIGPLSAGALFNTVTWIGGVGGNITHYNIYRGAPGLCQDLPNLFKTCAAVEAAFLTCQALITQFFASYAFIGSSTIDSFNDTGQTASGQAPPTVNSSGPIFYLDDIGVFVGDVGQWFSNPPGFAVIQRANSDFVIGASPLYPLAMTATGQVTTVFDNAAPYGQLVSYTAWITSGQNVSQPTPISAQVRMGQAPDTCSLWKRTGWASDVDETGQLISFLAGIGNMIQTIDDMASDQMLDDGTTAPGWSQILDINRCPKVALPWLGQFVGARFPTDLRDDQQRYMVENTRNWDRGTPSHITSQANLHLLPGYTVTLNERTPDPYSFQVVVPNAGVVGTATCLSILLAYRQCLQLPSIFPTCAAMWAGVAAIMNAIESSIPAGLIATIEFV